MENNSITSFKETSEAERGTAGIAKSFRYTQA